MISRVPGVSEGFRQLIRRHRQLFCYSPITITQSSAATSELQNDKHKQDVSKQKLQSRSAFPRGVGKDFPRICDTNKKLFGN